MATQRSALLLAMAACLVASAAAALPSAPFQNAGGPPFLNGPSYQWDFNRSNIVSAGLTVDGNYSFAYLGDEGDVMTEIASYTSWECGTQPGSYLAMADVKTIDANGEVIEGRTICEYGFVYANLMKNTWSQSEDECPTETTETSRFLGERPANNECGVPPPDYGAADGPASDEGSLVDQLMDDLDEP